MFYALIENGEITRINISLPISIGNTSIGAGATDLEEFGLYPIMGNEPTFDPIRERLAGPSYEFDGTQVNRVFTVEQIPDEEKATEVRRHRNILLAEWVDRMNPIVWEVMTEEQKQSWRDYRQLLLDVPNQIGFPWAIEWPENPSELAKRN